MSHADTQRTRRNEKNEQIKKFFLRDPCALCVMKVFFKLITSEKEAKMDVINLKEKALKISGLNEYHVIGKMNNYNFTLIKTDDRKLDFHSHRETDEVFFVVEGEMKLEFRAKTLTLKAGEMCIVPKGTEHRPVCYTPVTALLIEPDGTLNAENTGGSYERTD